MIIRQRAYRDDSKSHPFRSNDIRSTYNNNNNNCQDAPSMSIERSDSPDMSTPIIPPEDEADLENSNRSSSSEPFRWCESIGEFLACLVPVPIGVALEVVVAPYQRPIPYQATEGADGGEEYLRALVYDNEESGETVSSGLMTILAIAVPFVLQFCLAWCSHRRASMIQKTVCVWPMAIGLTQTITNLAKLYVGYLRPIFYDLCVPDEDYQECTDEDHSSQGRKSFPSGHASLSVCGLLLLSLFLEYSYGVTAYRKPGTPKPHKLVRIVSVLCYTPVLLALFIRKYSARFHRVTQWWWWVMVPPPLPLRGVLRPPNPSVGAFVFVD